jgi:crotonobetainyl-CoA:carnitine CoA-transferase CaiB-like acyl-CoA transferase
LQGGEGNPPVSFTVADITTGLAAATAITLAIRARETQGVGQHVDVTMIGAMAYAAADAFVDYAGKPAGAALDSGQHGFGPTYRVYPTADGWLFVAALGPVAAAALRTMLQQSEPRDTAGAEQTFAGRSTAEWLAVLAAAGIPAADALTDAAGFLHQTPDFRANGTRIAVATDRYGRLGQAGVAVRFSRTPVRVEQQEPELGAQTEEVLRRLGVSDEALVALRAAGTIPA